MDSCWIAFGILIAVVVVFVAGMYTAIIVIGRGFRR